MENLQTQHFDKLEEWLQVKSYEQLTPSEKQQASAVLNKDEYENIRDFYRYFSEKNTETKISPNDLTKKSLDKHFEHLNNKNVPVCRRRIPFYQSVAAAAACFVAGYLLSFSVERINSSGKMVENMVRDTIQVIRYVQPSAAVIPAAWMNNLLWIPNAYFNPSKEKNVMLADSSYYPVRDKSAAPNRRALRNSEKMKSEESKESL